MTIRERPHAEVLLRWGSIPGLCVDYPFPFSLASLFLSPPSILPLSTFSLALSFSLPFLSSPPLSRFPLPLTPLIFSLYHPSPLLSLSSPLTLASLFLSPPFYSPFIMLFPSSLFLPPLPFLTPLASLFLSLSFHSLFIILLPSSLFLHPLPFFVLSLSNTHTFSLYHPSPLAATLPLLLPPTPSLITPPLLLSLRYSLLSSFFLPCLPPFSSPFPSPPPSLIAPPPTPSLITLPLLLSLPFSLYHPSPFPLPCLPHSSSPFPFLIELPLLLSLPFSLYHPSSFPASLPFLLRFPLPLPLSSHSLSPHSLSHPTPPLLLPPPHFSVRNPTILRIGLLKDVARQRGMNNKLNSPCLPCPLGKRWLPRTESVLAGASSSSSSLLLTPIHYPAPGYLIYELNSGGLKLHTFQIDALNHS